MIQELLCTFAKPRSNVLVPFAGSGNTLLAAANLGMKALGFDLGEEYKNAYVIKVEANLPPDYHSYKKGEDE